MTDTTAISGITYPLSDDGPNVPSHMLSMATDLDDILIPRFASTAARDSAIPSPSDGQHCYLTGSSPGLYVYRNSYSQWQRISYSQLYHKSANENVSNTTYQDDNHLVGIPYKANTYYSFDLTVLYSANATNDVKLRLIWDSTPADGQWSISYSGAGMFAAMASASGGLTDALVIGGFGTGSGHLGLGQGFVKTHASTSGTVKLQWAQNSSHADAITLYRGTYLELKEAF